MNEENTSGNPQPAYEKYVKLNRVRFEVPVDDYRPVSWPIPYPYWCSSTHNEPIDKTKPDDDENLQLVHTLVAYVPQGSMCVYLTAFWPEHRSVQLLSEGHTKDTIAYSERFAKPEWYE